MRKYIIILIILLPFLGSAQEIKLESGYRLTYSPRERYKVGEQVFNQGDFGFTYQLRVSWKSLRLISNTSIFMDSHGALFNPNNSTFDIKVEYRLNDFKLSVGHKCCHPMKTDGERERFGIYGGYSIMVGISYNFE